MLVQYQQRKFQLYYSEHVERSEVPYMKKIFYAINYNWNFFISRYYNLVNWLCLILKFPIRQNYNDSFSFLAGSSRFRKNLIYTESYRISNVGVVFQRMTHLGHCWGQGGQTLFISKSVNDSRFCTVLQNLKKSRENFNENYLTWNLGVLGINRVKVLNKSNNWLFRFLEVWLVYWS